MCKRSFNSNILNVRLFGSMVPGEVKPSDIAQYLMIRGRKTKTCANGEIGVLSAMYTHAVSLGICESKPCLRVKRHKIGPRDRYIEDWELKALESVCNEFMNCYVTLKYLIGVRQTDMLMLTLDDIKEDGLFVRPNKTLNSTGETRIFFGHQILRRLLRELRNYQDQNLQFIYFVRRMVKVF